MQEPQPPSIDGIDFGFRAPAPPEGLGPQPPSPPNPALLELFQKNPAAFTALYSNKEKRDVTDRRYPTYDQFLTAAVISGIDLRNREYTMFAPEDNFFKKFNISLPILALKNKNCVAQIVRYMVHIYHLSSSINSKFILILHTDPISLKAYILY